VLFRSGDLSSKERAEIVEAISEVYPGKPQSTKSLIANMIWSFYHDIKPGDVILSRKGRKILAAVGTVMETAHYAQGENPLSSHPHFLSVRWHEEPREKVFPSVVFPMHTLSEVSQDQYDDFVSGTALINAPDYSEKVEDQSAFILEKYLEEFIVTNFEMIFKNKLLIYEDDEGNNGQQYSTDIGAIDILSYEPKTHDFVVIELKKGRPSDQVVGQVLRYMGWVRKNLCPRERKVKGLIICQSPDPKLSYAIEMTDNIEVRYYTVSFSLSE
jgi:restriction system protein